MQNSYNKRWVFGLLLACPLKTPSSQCPLNKLRNKSSVELISLVELYSGHEIDSILRYHTKCLHTRESTLVM